MRGGKGVERDKGKGESEMKERMWRVDDEWDGK